MHSILHSFDSRRGRHSVRTAHPMPMEFTFEARKNAALYLRINGASVATEYCIGNLSAKIAHATYLLKRCASDAPFLRDLADRAIVRKTGKRDELLRHADEQEREVQLIRAFVCK